MDINTENKYVNTAHYNFSFNQSQGLKYYDSNTSEAEKQKIKDKYYQQIIRLNDVGLKENDQVETFMQVIKKKGIKNSIETNFVSQMLQKIKYFYSSDLPVNRIKDLSNLVMQGKITNYLAGDTVFNQGDMGKDFYILLRGRCSLYLPDKNIDPTEQNMENSGKYKEIKSNQTQRQMDNFSNLIKQHMQQKKQEAEQKMDEEDKQKKKPQEQNQKTKKPGLGGKFLKNIVQDNKKYFVDYQENLQKKMEKQKVIQGNRSKAIIYIKPEDIEQMLKNMKYCVTFSEGDTFGEITVLTNKPRTGTVVCNEDCDFLCIEQKVFQNIFLIIKHRQYQEQLAFFNQFQFMKVLRDSDMMSILYSVKKQKYNIGSTIFKEGDKVENIYIIIKGEVKMTKSYTKEQLQEMEQQQQQDDNIGNQFVKTKNGKSLKELPQFMNSTSMYKNTVKKPTQYTIILVGPNNYFGDVDIFKTGKLKSQKRTQNAISNSSETEVYAIDIAMLLFHLKRSNQLEILKQTSRLKQEISDSRKKSIDLGADFQRQIKRRASNIISINSINQLNVKEQQKKINLNQQDEIQEENDGKGGNYEEQYSSKNSQKMIRLNSQKSINMYGSQGTIKSRKNQKNKEQKQLKGVDIHQDKRRKTEFLNRIYGNILRQELRQFQDQEMNDTFRSFQEIQEDPINNVVQEFSSDDSSYSVMNSSRLSVDTKRSGIQSQGYSRSNKRSKTQKIRKQSKKGLSNVFKNVVNTQKVANSFRSSLSNNSKNSKKSKNEININSNLKAKMYREKYLNTLDSSISKSSNFKVVNDSKNTISNSSNFIKSMEDINKEEQNKNINQDKQQDNNINDDKSNDIMNNSINKNIDKNQNKIQQSQIKMKTEPNEVLNSSQNNDQNNSYLKLIQQVEDEHEIKNQQLQGNFFHKVSQQNQELLEDEIIVSQNINQNYNNNLDNKKIVQINKNHKSRFANNKNNNILINQEDANSPQNQLQQQQINNVSNYQRVGSNSQKHRKIVTSEQNKRNYNNFQNFSSNNTPNMNNNYKSQNQSQNFQSSFKQYQMFGANIQQSVQSSKQQSLHQSNPNLNQNSKLMQNQFIQIESQNQNQKQIQSFQYLEGKINSRISNNNTDEQQLQKNQKINVTQDLDNSKINLSNYHKDNQLSSKFQSQKIINSPQKNNKQKKNNSNNNKFLLQSPKNSHQKIQELEKQKKEVSYVQKKNSVKQIFSQSYRESNIQSSQILQRSQNQISGNNNDQQNQNVLNQQLFNSTGFIPNTYQNINNYNMYKTFQSSNSKSSKCNNNTTVNKFINMNNSIDDYLQENVNNTQENNNIIQQNEERKKQFQNQQTVNQYLQGNYSKAKNVKNALKKREIILSHQNLKQNKDYQANIFNEILNSTINSKFDDTHRQLYDDYDQKVVNNEVRLPQFYFTQQDKTLEVSSKLEKIKAKLNPNKQNFLNEQPNRMQKQLFNLLKQSSCDNIIDNNNNLKSKQQQLNNHNNNTLQNFSIDIDKLQEKFQQKNNQFQYFNKGLLENQEKNKSNSKMSVSQVMSKTFNTGSRNSLNKLDIQQQQQQDQSSLYPVKNIHVQKIQNNIQALKPYQKMHVRQIQQSSLSPKNSLSTRLIQTGWGNKRLNVKSSNNKRGANTNINTQANTQEDFFKSDVDFLKIKSSKIVKIEYGIQ